jgi:hypothetical protein
VSEQLSPALHPLMLLQDRYGGTYSGGEWLAVREADQLCEGQSRAAWIVDRGPSGNDREAAGFWSEPPSWIAVGESPEAAIKALVEREIEG